MTNSDTKNNVLNILIVLLLVIYAFYANYPKHGDFLVMNYVARSFAIGNYDFYTDILDIQKLPRGFVAYPPTWYMIQGFYIRMLSLIFSYDLHGWIWKIRSPIFMPFFGILPNMIIFFMGGLVIFKMYPEKKELLLYYLISPLAFISIEIMGQIDIYPTFFTLLSLYFVRKGLDDIMKCDIWKILSIISLGIGGQFKLYPLLLLMPISIFLANKKFVQTIKYTSLGIVISLIPWVGYMKWFKFIVIDGESNWLFSLQLVMTNVSHPYHTMSIWVIGYCIMLWMIFKYINVNFKNIVGIIFMEISWFFITVYTQPQWWVWLLPIYILVLAEFKRREFIFFYIILNLLYILYSMMWKGIDNVLREYIDIIPTGGMPYMLPISIIVTVLLIWNFELITEINKREDISR